MSAPVPVKLVIDCSASGAPSPEMVAALEADALELLRNGQPDAAASVMQSVQAASDAAARPVETLVPLTADELAQRDLDQAAAADAAKAQAAADAAQAALVAKLTSGSATSAEIQSALAQLLG